MRGWIEYFDDAMLRLTREGSPTCSSTRIRFESISEAGGGRTPRYSKMRRERAREAGRERTAPGETI